MRLIFIWKFFLLASLVLIFPHPTSAGGIYYVVPEGFYLIQASTGVELYRKDFSRGSPDFVQVVNLEQGALVVLMHGDLVDLRQGKGVYGGNDPRMLSRSLLSYWEDFSTNYPSAFCVTNGQFFYMREYPTRLPFPLKKGGFFVSDGYGLKEFPQEKLILEIWPDRVEIQPLTQESLFLSDAPDIVGGLKETARKSPDRSVGRTFIGVSDVDGNGINEILLIFNTLYATQKEAAEVLREFGAEKVMMLDGGGSTQLICKGEALIESERLLPQAIGIAAGFSLQKEPTATPTKTITLTPNPTPYPTKETLQGLLPASPWGDEAINGSMGTVKPAEKVSNSNEPYWKIKHVLWVPIILLLISPVFFFFIKRSRSKKNSL